MITYQLKGRPEVHAVAYPTAALEQAIYNGLKSLWQSQVSYASVVFPPGVPFQQFGVLEKPCCK